MKLDDITYKINGCAMKVHNTLGNGFQEVIYQRCLAIELEKAGLSYAREQDHDIYYEGIMVGTRRADFVVEDKVVVEIKALINNELIINSHLSLFLKPKIAPNAHCVPLRNLEFLQSFELT